MNDGLTSGFGKAPSAAIVLAKAGSVTFPGFSFVGDKDTGLWNPTSNSLAFAVGGIEMMRMTAAQVLMGTTTALVTRVGVSNISPRLQAAGTTGTLSSMGQFAYNVSGSAAPYTLHAKSRNSAVGGHTIVADGDLVGAYSAAGSDGVQFTEAARIEVRVDGDPALNSMPGRLVFCTTPIGQFTPVEAMRIDDSQNCLMTGAGATGYGAGAGGTVTQLTNKNTNVTLNKLSGRIFMATGAIAAGAEAVFDVFSSGVTAVDVPVLAIATGAAGGSYCLSTVSVSAGSFKVSLRNLTAGSLNESVTFSFVVMRGSIT